MDLSSLGSCPSQARASDSVPSSLTSWQICKGTRGPRQLRMGGPGPWPCEQAPRPDSGSTVFADTACTCQRVRVWAGRSQSPQPLSGLLWGGMGSQSCSAECSWGLAQPAPRAHPQNQKRPSPSGAVVSMALCGVQDSKVPSGTQVTFQPF